MLNLDAYLARIGYNGPRTPTLAVLAELQRRHVYTIPFENLDVLLGRPIRLDLPSIEQKIVQGRRGGYCFEQNTLFKAALTTLGFKVESLIGRVRWQIPAGAETAKTHMVLLVELDGKRYLADGGFGSGSLTAPLDLDTDELQPTSHEPRRIIRRDGFLVHQIRIGEEWADLYQFSLQPMLAIDYEVANWYTSTFPQSRFMLNLIAAITADGQRRTLLNRELTTRWTDGRVEKRELKNRTDLLAALNEHFYLSFSPDTRFHRTDAPWPT